MKKLNILFKRILQLLSFDYIKYVSVFKFDINSKRIEQPNFFLKLYISECKNLILFLEELDNLKSLTSLYM